ncbi:MAG: hypothetical protein EA362_09475 [Saprospirales bacterium]|nr:MAG: hypothetical protein EA362_09475 [Saprospirales bacterium]
MLKAYFTKYTLKFKVPAGTSRGYLYNRLSWYMVIQDTKQPAIFGIGDCGLIPGLSIDPVDSLDEKLNWLCDNIHLPLNELRKKLKSYPALIFAVETALWDLQNGGKRKVFKTDFSNKENPMRIPINGLIWMGEPDYMIKQIGEKIDDGFNVLKLKVGALDFQKELNVLQHIRSHYKEKDLEIRLDANGAFSPDEALKKLEALSPFSIQSIEQPIKPDQHSKLTNIIKRSPIPIALDEELIGKHINTDKHQMLSVLKPHYIILKPSLLGGFYHTQEWITSAEKLDIKWWITSALESNIGLNAIAQFCSTFDNPLPQGLGTGQLYTNNINSPLTIEKGHIFSHPNKKWRIDFSKLAKEQLWFKPIKIEGKTYIPIDFSQEKNLPKGLDQNLFHFLQKWYDSKLHITFKTSGSTGKPKTIRLIKKMMLNSAERTNDYFKIREGGNALLCLSTEHIAGAMMVVRAIAGKLNLIIADHFGSPLVNIDKQIEFTAMVPTQVVNSLQQKTTANRLLRIEKTIIGGAPLEEKYLPVLMKTLGRIWTTYGMTETISHVAAAPLINDKIVYEVLPGVELWTNKSGKLIISDNCTGIKKIETNDIVHLIDKRHFIWKGRAGQVINRAGYKISPDEIIKKLKTPLPYPIIILNFEHPKYFQVPVLAIEKKDTRPSDYPQIAKIISKSLPKKLWPAGIHIFDRFPLRKNAIKPDLQFLAQTIQENSEKIFNFDDFIHP